MFVSFFKSNNASAYIFIPVFAIALWVFGIIHPVALPPVKHAMPFYELLAGPVTNTWLNIILALILIIGEAFFLNYIVNENEILTRPSFLPAVLYIIFMSSNKAMYILHPLIFGNFFLMLAIHRLLNSYRKEKAFSHFFDAGFLISIASLFYFPYIVFFPILVNTVVALRSIDAQSRDLMRSLNATAWQVFRLLEVPASLPILLGGVRMGVTLCVIGAVVGEFVGADTGLGALVNIARGLYDTPLMFVAIIALMVLAMSLYFAVSLLERLTTRQ